MKHVSNKYSWESRDGLQFEVEREEGSGWAKTALLIVSHF